MAALKTLGLGNPHNKYGLAQLKVGKPNLWFFTMKSGPNAPIAVLGIGFDLLG